MNTAFTPGPWFTSRPHGTIYIESRLRGSLLQEVAAAGPTETPSQQEANARLIAAAPDLLAALQEFVSNSSAQVNMPDACERAERAIAKAVQA